MQGDREIFRDLLQVSGLRGLDSTGVAAVSMSRSVHIKKVVGNSTNFVANELNDKRSILKMHNLDLLMGHTRWATKGWVTAENAHPFRTKHLIGAHNGTLHDKKFRDKEKTDSEMMFSEMDKEGVVPTLQGLDWGAAFAISVYDISSDTLWLTRNSERSLYVARSTTHDVVYWASELQMLSWALSRNGLKNPDFRMVEKDTALEIPLNNIARYDKKEDNDYWNIHSVARKVKPFPKMWPEVIVNTNHHVGPEKHYAKCDYCLRELSVAELTGPKIYDATGSRMYVCNQCAKNVTEYEQERKNA